VAELIAIGKGKQQRWWQSLPADQAVLLGRAPRNGWSVPWDRLISREHAVVRLDAGVLHVEELETARNPIFFQGEPCKSFDLDPNGEFRIGETTFRFEVRENVAAVNPTVVEHTLGDAQLPPGRFENASACLEALCAMPRLISQTHSDVEFATGVVDLLLDSLRGALAAAVIQFDASANELGLDDPKLIRWSSRDEEVKRFRPSRRLMGRALERGQSVVHLWTETDEVDSTYTMTSDLDWAFCTPIPTVATERWCLYVSGRRHFSGMRDVQCPNDLMAELKLAELTAHFIGAVRQVRVLEHQQTEMRQFFSPAVIETLQSESSGALLAPRQGQVSVLFCDVRGFSRKVEESRDDLQALLVQVSEALSVMTRSILKYEGVIADFQGDATLGFWGWPSRSDDAALSACRAALLIASTFAAAQQQPDHPLCGFRIGIGVGLGDAIAGRIGAQEQIKVGVFGPIVNLASRLQDLTKQVGVSILVDRATVEQVADPLKTLAANFRHVGRLRPAGVATPVDAYALMSRAAGEELLDPRQQAESDHAVEALIQGDWRKATRLLAQLPPHDGPANFLRNAICQHGGQPPGNWDGVLSMGRDGFDLGQD
jgi:adenylate cyclase